MYDLLNYGGPAVLLVVVAFCLAFLAKRGLKIRRFKHKQTEVEFDTGNPATASSNGAIQTGGEKVAVARPPTKGQVSLEPELVSDCKSLGVESSEIEQFILREAERHPLLFLNSFSSLPLVFFKKILLVSWDLDQVKAERLLSREDAYPMSKVWGLCLAGYRKATLLPYRLNGPKLLVSTAESKRSLATYRRLVDAANDFLNLIEGQIGTRPAEFDGLSVLVEQAELSLAQDDIGTATAQMEAVLSTVHKLILNYAPQGVRGREKNETTDEPRKVKVVENPAEKPSRQSKGATVLVVDDDGPILRVLREMLTKMLGYEVVACDDPRDALKALVENHFDAVITDFVMPHLDGGQVILAALNADPDIKTMIISGYCLTAERSDIPMHAFLQKPFSVPELKEGIEKLLHET